MSIDVVLEKNCLHYYTFMHVTKPAFPFFSKYFSDTWGLEKFRNVENGVESPGNKLSASAINPSRYPFIHSLPLHLHRRLMASLNGRYLQQAVLSM